MRKDELNDVNAGATGSEPLSRLDDYEMADGYPDVRGWRVTTADGRDVGRVRELLCDVGALEVRYLVVEREGAGTGDLRIPLKGMRLDDDDDRVVVDAAYAAGLAESATGIATAGTATAARTGAAAGEQRITRSEEELAIDKRRVAAGALGIRKRVVTEHVTQPVQTQREEVTVERRPVTDGRAATTAQAIGEGEIRVPIVEEEVVVEKRPVVKEELVIRTKEVTETQQVQADVRRERVDVEREAGRPREDDRPRDVSGR